MRQRALWVISMIVLVAVPAAAQVSVTQDSCLTTGPNPVVYFSIVNPASAPLPVCQMAVVPVSAQCFPLQCGAPVDWTCFPGDVTTFFQASAAVGACVEPGEAQSGFQVTIFSDPCCFQIGFMAADGTHLGNVEFCFDCGSVGVERETWGHVKQLYE